MRFLVPRSRSGTAVRVFVAAVLVIGSSAAAVATAGLLQVNQIVQDISVHTGVRVKQLTLPKPGRPQTLLIIGSDHRFGAPFSQANTDTMLLVRLNSASSTINLMSIPRDLKVNVPGYGIEKLNAAYSEGSYGLLIKTIKTNVFPDLHVNHIIDTNFTGFSDLVDAIGCVYSDVDHRYYNISQPGADDYSSIDIQPGYQRLCGHNQAINGALPFVRFRHTDTDLVREARQQDFIRWAKQSFPISRLLGERDKLLTIFGKHSTLDQGLHTEAGLLELFDLVAFSDGDTLKQVPFPADLSATPLIGPDYVTAEPAQEASAFREFMRPTAHRAASHAVAHPAHARHPTAAHRRGRATIDTAGVQADPLDGKAQAKVLTPDMPVYYPRLIRTGSVYCTPETYQCLDGDEPATAYAHSYPRAYEVTEPDGKRVHAYRMTIVINALQGQYYGVQGLHWTDAPILRDPQATKVFRGRTYDIYEDDGGHFTTVAFRVGANAYWISNTLTSAIPNHEMMAIAESMTRYGG